MSHFTCRRKSNARNEQTVLEEYLRPTAFTSGDGFRPKQLRHPLSFRAKPRNRTLSFGNRIPSSNSTPWESRAVGEGSALSRHPNGSLRPVVHLPKAEPVNKTFLYLCKARSLGH